MELLTSDIFLDLFQHRGWEIKEDKYSLFNRFCKTYDSFATKEEKALFLKIARFVVNVTLPDYCDLNSSLLLRIDALNEGARLINIAPMKDSNDRVSSSDFVAYLCKSKDSYYIQELAGKSIQVYGLEFKFDTLDGNLFIVDDFIGTGTTASSAFEYYQKRGLKKEKLFICSYYVTTFFLQSAFYKKNKEHICFLHTVNCAKDLFSKSEQELLDSDAFRLKVKETLEFEKVGSVISLLRTPNNSLPILWKKRGSKHEPSSAPFPRIGR